MPYSVAHTSTKTLSILIPTLGREKELLRTLEFLVKLDPLPLEIVVVDQNQPPFESVVEFCQKNPVIRHCPVAVPGLVNNYNHALRLAQGEIVLFLDDDVDAKPGLVAHHLKHYTDPSIVGVAGRILEKTARVPAEKVRAHQIARYHRWLGEVVFNFNALVPADVDSAPGGNMSFRRQELLDAGAFDEGFAGTAYFFEVDVSLRAQCVNGKRVRRLVFDPEAEVFHWMASAGGARLKDKARHTYYFIRNGIRLYWRHSPVLGRPLFLLKSCAYVIAKSLKNMDLRILTQGLKAVWDGVRQ